MNKKIRLIIISIILILGILLINQLKYRNDELYAVNLKNKIDKDLVSILVSDGSNNYTNYEGNTLPSNTEYTFNSELSKCQDNNGNVIEGILSYDEGSGKVSIRTKKTTYCYLYFDKKSTSFAEELIASGELWQSGLEGDGYRYIGTGVTCSYDNGKHIESNNQYTTPSCPTLYNYTRTRISNGTTVNYTYKPSCPSNDSDYTYNCTEVNGTPNASNIPNNFICFGTNNLSECKANEGKYMYRIIGVFPDETGEQHLKLIKYKQLSERYMWHSVYDVDVSWEESDLYKGLNGISGDNLFIGNATYDYLQENNPWYEKIVDWKWTATNTLTCGEDGQCNDETSGPDYSSITTEQVYLHEMNKTKPTEVCISGVTTNASCNFDIGAWTYLEAKIGLMYASDYQMSLGSSSLPMTSINDYDTLKTGWLHPSNNDSTADTWEWLISRMGNYFDYGYFFAWYVGGGDVSIGDVLSDGGLSPVFYLDSTVTALDGNGSYDTPYLING